MTKPMEYDLILTCELDVLASAVKTYMRSGWVPKGEVITYQDNFAQEMERPSIKTRKVNRSKQKSWVPWTKQQ